MKKADVTFDKPLWFWRPWSDQQWIGGYDSREDAEDAAEQMSPNEEIVYQRMEAIRFVEDEA